MTQVMARLLAKHRQCIPSFAPADPSLSQKRTNFAKSASHAVASDEEKDDYDDNHNDDHNDDDDAT